MRRAAIWIAAIVAFGGALYWIGRQDGTHALDAKTIDSLGGVIEQQAAINAENLQIVDRAASEQVEQARVTETIKQERREHEKPGAVHLSRGDVRLLNASRRNQRPETLRPRLSDEEERGPSTVTEQTLIDADIDCARRYNACKTKRNALIDIVRAYQEKQRDFVCK